MSVAKFSLLLEQSNIRSPSNGPVLPSSQMPCALSQPHTQPGLEVVPACSHRGPPFRNHFQNGCLALHSREDTQQTPQCGPASQHTGRQAAPMAWVFRLFHGAASEEDPAQVHLLQVKFFPDLCFPEKYFIYLGTDLITKVLK